MTREEAVLNLILMCNLAVKLVDNSDFPKALEMAFEALEQEPILDKIRAEIEDMFVDSLIFGELIDFKNGKISADDVMEEFNRVTRKEVLQIIDNYKAESENDEV